MAVWSVVSTKDLPGFRLDPEYYTPHNLRCEKAVKQFKGGWLPLAEMADIITDGDHLARDFQEDGVLFLTSEHFGEFSIDYNSDLFIAPAYEETLARARSEAWAIYLTKTGAHYGKAAVCPPGCPKFNVSADVAKIRLKPGFDPCFVACYLNSVLGFTLVRRESTGATRDRIVLENLRSLIVPVPPKSDRFKGLVQSLWAKQTAGVQALAAAEALLVSALGLDTLDLTPARSYSRPITDLLAARRFGAEYFMPCKQRILDALRASPHKTIAHHAPGIREMWNPAEARKGEVVRNFDITAALEPILDDATEPTDAADIASTKKRFQAGDVLISRLRSYLKEIAVARVPDAPPCVGSSEFIVLRPTGQGLSAETLLIYLRSPLIQTILKWSQDGSAHPRFDEDDLLALPVPDRLLKVAPKIDAKVRAAFAARREAAGLLAKAKATIEAMIGGEA